MGRAGKSSAGVTEGGGCVWNLASQLPTSAFLVCHFTAGAVSQETESLHSIRKVLLRNPLNEALSTEVVLDCRCKNCKLGWLDGWKMILTYI